MRAVNIIEERDEGAAFRRSCNLIRIHAPDSLNLARNRKSKRSIFEVLQAGGRVQRL